MKNYYFFYTAESPLSPVLILIACSIGKTKIFPSPILSVLAEELGYVSILVVIIAINFFIYWCFVYANKIENKYISAIFIGFSTIIYMHMVINLAMISGILPVTGLPAPFISYGGSFFLTCSIIIGLINNSINNYL